MRFFHRCTCGAPPQIEMEEGKVTSNLKYVTWRGLAPGQKIESWKSERSLHMASASVKARNAAFVTLLVFGTHEEKVASEGTLFGVEMSTEEFHRAYQKEAEQLVASIQTRLSAYEIGYHEAWNAWLSHDPYEMAAECKKNQIRVLGHCTDILPRRNLLVPDLILDVGICAEGADGEKMWCHWSGKDLNDMVSSWKKRAEREACILEKTEEAEPC